MAYTWFTIDAGTTNADELPDSSLDSEQTGGAHLVTPETAREPMATLYLTTGGQTGLYRSTIRSFHFVNLCNNLQL